MSHETRLVRFADVEFDVKAGELRRAGMTTRLEPQPARVLAMLVERAGDVVTRAELQQHVWSGDTFVDFERGLNYCVAQIRTALGDSASTPRFIETLPRRGYRFIAPVQAGASSGGQASAGREVDRTANVGVAHAAERDSANILLTLSPDSGRSIGESREPRQPRQPRELQASQESQASQEPQESQASQEPQGSREPREAQEGSGTWKSGPVVRSRSTAADLAWMIGTWVLVIGGVLLAWSIVGRMPKAGDASGAASKAGSDAASQPAGAAATRPIRIAVALFDNDTKRPDYDQLAQTLTDAIVARLANDPSRITVIGNATILRQVRSFRDVAAIGAKLGTEHVILGQVQEIAGQLRVTAHLIRAADEGHVWARRFEPSERDMPTLDRTVADAVAGAVAAKLLGQ